MMYSIKINYGLDTNRRKIFISKKELKKAFKTEKDFDKFMKKIENEVKKDAN